MNNNQEGFAETSREAFEEFLKLYPAAAVERTVEGYLDTERKVLIAREDRGHYYVRDEVHGGR